MCGIIQNGLIQCKKGGYMNTKLENIKEYVDESKLRFDEPMSKHTTIKIGGNADVLVLPENTEDIQNVLKFAKENMIPVTVIGNGSKLLVLDGGIRGIVIKLGSRFADYKVEGKYITVAAGMTLPRLAIIAKDNSLSGLEFAAGIPGYVGGSVYMNAGAYGSEMSNVIENVTYLDENLEVVTKSKEELDFGYRSSFFKNNKDKNYVVLETKLKLEVGDKEQIAELMKKNNDARREKQPLEYPNAGSTFKRPEGYFVGKLIDDLGLKGYTVGNAQVSTKHSGFIVNLGGATAKDVVSIIEYIKEKVLEKFNVKLEEEIIIIGEGE